MSQSEADDAGMSRTRWATYAVILAITCGVLTAAVCRVKPLLSANDRSRWCTVWSLVDRGTFQIDEIDAVPGWGTIDKVRHQGHYYSSKPPLFPAMVAGVYWLVRAVTGWTLFDQTDETARTILLIVNVIPLLVGVFVMIRLAERYARTDFTRIFLVATFALATFLTTFSVTLNNHTVAALAILFSTYAACRILADGSTCPRHFVIAGFFAAFAAVNELPAASFAVAVFAWLLRQSPGRTLKWFVPAACLPLAAFFLTTYVATGDWKTFYFYYGTEKYKYVVDGVPSYWMQPAGLDANVERPLVYLLHCTFGHHGIFSLSPIFLLALAAWVVPPLSRQFRLRGWLWLSAGLTVVVLGFYLTRTQNYNYGGNTAGLRWIFWLIPLWIVSLIPALDACAGRRPLRILAAALLAITTFSSWYPIDNPWQHPWLFRLMERWGWIDYRHRPEEFNRPVTTFFPLLPPDESAREWIEYGSAEPTGQTTRLRLADQGTVEQGGRRLRKITAVWNAGTHSERTEAFIIDPAAFATGEPPAKFLDWPNQPPDAAARKQAETFLQGLPSVRAYRRGTLRYLKTPLRHDAFECRLAAARVAPDEDSQPDAATDHSEMYRIDVWLTAAVPFGVLQFDQTVRDGDTGEVLSSSRFTAIASGRSFEGNAGKAIPPAKSTHASNLNIPGD
ncbi:MAG TPA: hypothetical protein VMR25_23355 [Planctomycetaceae bacterium]|jgi:hypothetical protein|nr:hypothetical protein [Planctomycetaceae bacterium]